MTVSKYYFDHLLMMSQFTAVSLLLENCNDVYYIKPPGRDPVIKCVFYKFSVFRFWQDYVKTSAFTYSYVRRFDDTVVVHFTVKHFFKSLIHPSKWTETTKSDAVGVE